MYRTSDSGPHSIYRVTVYSSNYRSNTAALTRVNVKASSPTAAAEWVLTHPGLARVPSGDYMAVTAAYKLRKQPVWLKKTGTLTARFDMREIIPVSRVPLALPAVPGVR